MKQPGILRSFTSNVSNEIRMIIIPFHCIVRYALCIMHMQDTHCLFPSSIPNSPSWECSYLPWASGGREQLVLVAGMYISTDWWLCSLYPPLIRTAMCQEQTSVSQRMNWMISPWHPGQLGRGGGVDGGAGVGNMLTHPSPGTTQISTRNSKEKMLLIIVKWH